MSKKVYICTYGCQMNKYDSELLLGLLRGGGYDLAESETEADLILVNTCSVREHAERRALGRLRQLVNLKKDKPGMLVGVYGCMAQRYGEKLFEEVHGLDVVAGPDAFPYMLDILNKAGESRQTCTLLGDFVGTGMKPHRLGNKLTAWSAITRGCNNYCSYCIVPYVRGRERSRPLEDILQEVQNAVQNGVREITFLGQNVNSYHDGRHDFADLLYAANVISGLWRIRFATSHPKDLSDKLIEAIATNHKVCEHIHLPVQSGSDRVLGLMNRGYSRKNYLDLVKRIKSALPEVALTTDLITGFPSESELDFQETIDLMYRVEFSGAFTFKYSPRPGTRAAGLPNDVPEIIKVQRLERMIKVQQELAEIFSKNLLGTTQEVMFEEKSPRNPRHVRGRARNGKIVEVDSHLVKIGEVWQVSINATQTWVLFGNAIKKIEE
ncbi:tRNA (N6-isopentenyl adenosine(37)-C2)-methylthiotransferase MiaB [bacterium]|nr:tRNA (N6-isopentenyl adenosine(37)-C2)-methylthiotransferase MiaB [bacterium]